MPHVKQHLSLNLPPLCIICTSGPAIYKAKTIDGVCQTEMSHINELLDAGMRMLRINFSHVTPQQYPEIECLIAHVRELEKTRGQPIPIMMDLQGPEIRITKILGRAHKPLQKVAKIEKGQMVEISIEMDATAKLDPRARYRMVVSFDGQLYPQMKEGENVVVGDNVLYLKIKERVAGGFLCQAQNNEDLLLRQGLNLPGRTNLEAPVLVESDKQALKHGFDVDLIAQSFVRNSADISELHGFLAGTPLPNDIPIIAKIETPNAVLNIDSILQTRGVFGIMVARGDLGVLANYEQMPQFQERIIDAANKAGKPVIVATQMLENMMIRPQPLRPEVEGIRTAIREGADALMLSGETAKGEYPRETVQEMAGVMRVNMPVDQDQYRMKFKGKFGLPTVSRPIDALGYAICEVADEAGSPFILTYATSGISATLISRLRPKVPVIAITNRQDTARKLCLVYHVYPVLVDAKELPRQPSDFISFLREIVAELKLAEHLPAHSERDSTTFLVGTQELSKTLKAGEAQGIFVFEP